MTSFVNDQGGIDLKYFDIDYHHIAKDIIKVMSPKNKDMLARGTVPMALVEETVRMAEEKSLRLFPQGKLDDDAMLEFKENISLALLAEAGAMGLIKGD